MTTSGYQLRRTSEPEAESVSLEQVKRWLNLDSDITEDDELLTDLLIPSAREFVENETRLVLVDSIFEMKLDDFDRRGSYLGWFWSQEIRLPVQPLIQVIDVQYLGTDGQYVSLPSTDWLEVKDEPPRIVSNPSGNCWPVLLPRPGAVLVTFRAGYESAGSPQDAASVPTAIKLAMQMLIAHWYEHREALSSDHRNTPTEIPLGTARLLEPYRRII
jgi:uncharacterized phiE125 gp8 family phage protein